MMLFSYGYWKLRRADKKGGLELIGVAYTVVFNFASVLQLALYPDENQTL